MNPRSKIFELGDIIDMQVEIYGDLKLKLESCNGMEIEHLKNKEEITKRIGNVVGAIKENQKKMSCFLNQTDTNDRKCLVEYLKYITEIIK